MLESAAVTVSEQYAEGIASGTTPVSLASMLPGLDITVTNANGDVLDSNKPIGTGCTVTAAYKNMSLLAKTVIIRGDVDGDGKVSASDYLRVRRYILGTMELDGLFENAADVDGDGKVNAADYIRIRRAILGM
ncbi:mannosyl-glycoprotein endo-beta-N-acetylglucosaminidase [Ruminococcus sp. CAG:382]|nr:mannosyl-glycoprotein endo-beta-N-acetylglucosaminidase [Ruminococcus sp. CAG:382]